MTGSPTDAAFDQILRDWNLIPMMPSQEMHDSAVRNMLERAEAAFGKEAAAAGWAKLGRNKGWHS